MLSYVSHNTHGAVAMSSANGLVGTAFTCPFLNAQWIGVRSLQFLLSLSLTSNMVTNNY